ncbi:MAG: hypothetical protein PQJ61_05535 [Spirochaetales bacterium]|uniref:Response regulatory domain-containing protein n=1 Tax=Candidatus Thalassospirochaeta sargassi TaxID=3119039 RepID=A0AAJ1IHA0_9SPIO|nr:hypothetical protein [Spirochaetales bacterium]
MDSKLSVILSDSGALIGDIEYVLGDQREFVSSDSLKWVQDFLRYHDVDLFIADMDIKIDEQTEVLNRLRELTPEETSLLLLVSERKKLELEKEFGGLGKFEVSADWLIKPFSRNALISSIDNLCE